MSIKVMTAVFETDLPPTEKIVALKLADHAHDDGTHVFPSAASVAAKCSMSERQVWRVIKSLLDKGIIVLEKSGGGRASNLYHFSLDAHGVIAPRSTDNLTHLDSPSTDTGVIAPMTSEDRSTDTGVIGINRTIIEPSSAKPSKDYTPEFEAWWKIYPKPVNKKGTFGCWNATLRERGGTVESLMLATSVFADQMLKEGREKQYIMNSPTFLGPGERWRECLPATIDPEVLEQARAWDDWDRGKASMEGFRPPSSDQYHPEPSFPRPQNSEGYLLDGEGRAYYRDPMQPTKRRYLDDE